MTPPCLVSANQVAHQRINDRSNMQSTSKRPVLPPATEGDTPHCILFQRRRVQEINGIPGANKAAGRDDVLVEYLKYIGPKVRR